mmetsp:Transcript_45457/g.89972  ORF Transcript_45457/g.89972 Transcript_45457/m.89972 type:complete len:555 (-) Transcript_45457:67-1731(-)
MVHDGVAFDFYDERWRDCWIAASSAARLRKRQIDFDIRQRVSRLLADYGPESTRPLTLRIYGTMIKGFCVINNERARALFTDCERVVLTFARQPFTGSGGGLSLPAAKRPRMEAALTLDLDLARVEASEAFDWTQAPLEEGALLRLGGCDDSVSLSGLNATAALPTGDSASLMDMGIGGVPPMLDPGAVCEALAPVQEAGWISRLGDAPLGPAPPLEPPEAVLPPTPHPVPDPVQPPAPEIPVTEPPAVGPVPLAAAEALQPFQAPLQQQQQISVMRKQPKVREVVMRPGIVYGFDDEPMLAPAEFARWQQDHDEFTLPRQRAAMHAETMLALGVQVDRLGPGLRAVLDPPGSEINSRGNRGLRVGPSGGMPAAGVTTLIVPPAAMASTAVPDLPDVGPLPHRLPEVQELLAGGTDTGLHAPPPGTDTGLHEPPPGFHAPPEFVEASAVAPAEPPIWPSAAAALTARSAEQEEILVGGAEAQDSRTTEVLEIIRGCLRSSGLQSAAFHEIVPPGDVDRATAACTFAALLALASARELTLEQTTPYGQIDVGEAH